LLYFTGQGAEGYNTITPEIVGLEKTRAMFSISPPTPVRKSPYVVSTEEAIEEIRAGRMIILMDDEDRENEGDLCMAAEKVTAETINFMAAYGRGLICLPMAEEGIDALGLPMMVSKNTAPLGTAFTVSIDARHGVTRGISAADRAITILTAVRDDVRPGDFVVPGHVFPLRARRGGVLVRTGQTEGAVDLSRLAGLKPAGVICEIMRDDGTMARLADLEEFSVKHGLKIATIADLIHYRLQHDSLVHHVADARLPTRYGGDFTAHVYTSDVDEEEHVVLVKGQITPEEPVLVRAHAEYLPGDVFGYTQSNTSALLHQAMEMIAAEGRGVLLYLRQEGQGAQLFRESGRSGRRFQHDGSHRLSTSPGSQVHDFRDYGIGAQILRDIGVRKLRLLTNSPPRRLASLTGYGLEIVEYVPLNGAGQDRSTITTKKGPRATRASA
jgi:3,4-dihydroxy 2-butanone 4-phosphate synthase/GTP cyclohydrolase II